MQKYLVKYLRLSMEDGDIASDNDKAESDSISHQRDIINSFITKEKLDEEYILQELIDDGYSGTNFNRPAMIKLLEMVKDGKVGCIVVKDISRFGRNYLEVGDYLEQIFPFMGVRFIAVNDYYDSNNYRETTGGVEVAFRSLMYDMYSKDLSVKMRSALKVRRKRGDYISPKPPFGYDFAENKKRLVVDPKAAEIVKKVFSLAVSGYSTGEIAKRLNRERIPTPGQYKNMQSGKSIYHISEKGVYWNPATVLRILENRVYLGVTVNAKNAATKVGGNQFKRVPDEERIYVPDTHDAIILEHVFENAAGVIKERGNQKYKEHNQSKRSILMGKLHCGNCGKSLIRVSGTTIPYYKCKRPDYDWQCGCPELHLQEPDIETVVWKCILQEIKRTENLKKEVFKNQSTSSLRIQMKGLEEAAEKYRNRKRGLYEAYKSDSLSKQNYMEQVRLIREKEGEAGNRLSELKKQQEAFLESADTIKTVSVTERLNREIVDALIENIKVYQDDCVEIVWKYPFC